MNEVPRYTSPMPGSYKYLLAFVVTLSTACSSSSPSASSANGDSGVDQNRDGGASCSCDVSYNGVSQSIGCGGSACVNGASFSCNGSANITQGGACMAPADGGGASDSGAVARVPCAYHDDVTDKDVTSCDAKTQYCLRSYSPNDGPGVNNVCAPLPSGCDGCDCASQTAESAWKAANNGTANCTGATIACDDSKGAITVDCIK